MPDKAQPLLVVAAAALPAASRAELGRLRRRLVAQRTLAKFLAAATQEAQRTLGFDRGTALDVTEHDDTGGWMARAVTVGRGLDPASEALRRRASAAAVELPGDPAVHDPRPALAQTLGLDQPLTLALTYAERTRGLLVIDRSGPAVRVQDERAARVLADVIGGVGAVVHLRQRTDALVVGLERAATVVRGLGQDTAQPGLRLCDDHGLVPAASAAPRAASPGGLTRREEQIYGLLSAGQSNREIATELGVSPETVKAHVARILRKLGAANRVEAAALSRRPRAARA